MKKYIVFLFLILTVILTICPIFAAETERRDSTANFPWAQQRSYYQTTGSFLTIGEEELERRTLGDLRNRLTGMMPAISVQEKAGDFWSSSYQSPNLNSSSFQVFLRGSGNQVCIVDDIYIPFGQVQLDPNQIESITVLTDILDKAKYGPMASDGALLIRTKKGGYNTPMQIHVDMEGGIGIADRIPEWVNGIEYARMNNAARAVSGYSQLYLPEALEGFSQKDPYDMKYPNVDYKSLMLKETLPLSRVGVNFNGGGDRVKYNFSFNGLYSGDIVKNSASNDYSKLNASASLTAKVGKYIEVSADFNILLSFRRKGRTSWYNYRSVPAVAFPLTLGQSLGDDGARLNTPIYGVSRTFTQNYYALGLEGGFNTERNRTGMLNTSIDLDLSWLIKGLKSRTLLGLTQFVRTTIGKEEDYLGYYWTSQDGIGAISTHTGTKKSGKSILSSYTMQSLSFYERLSYDWAANGHKIAAGATFVMNDNTNKSNDNYQRQLYVTADISYAYTDKYIVEFVAQYAGSSRFNKDNRFAFFPSAGLAWVISKENFMRDIRWIDNLKLHTQVGLIGETDIFGAPYLYQSDYSAATNGMWLGANSKQDSWFGTNRYVTQYVTMNRLANPDLGWGKLFQADLGLDFDFLQAFSFSANFYYRQSTNRIVNISDQLPAIFGLRGSDLYKNYTKEHLQGADFSLNYARTLGDWYISAGVNASTWKIVSDRLTNDEYIYDYQKRTGTTVDSYWGLKCIGKYETHEQISSLPAYTSDLQIGDLIYADINNDGQIDTNDRIILSHTLPRMNYAINLGFGYKNFEIQIVGTGAAFFQTPMTNSYFWNGWGDGNYSAFVRDNIGGDYPRLAYTKSSNNFVQSDFWLRDGGWFKIQDVELAYTLPFKQNNKVGIRNIRFSLKGQNLATISKIKDVDPESIDAGVTGYPLFRIITAGIKFNF